ncbi:MAG: GIY-YIG nuclease family protein [Symploca sp. SIO3C6]|nr:GIY-YIG nuclease family protein [Symploca sp. SIO3C6]
MEPTQLNLFSTTPRLTTRTESLVMSQDALERWKSQIFNYQQQVRKSEPPKQTALFELAPNHCEADSIDPFSLRIETLEFWRMPADSPGEACLYFVIDNTLPLLLYIGETCKSNKRWKGVHDCKQYLGNYHDLHYKYGRKKAVSIAFWWDAPTQTKARQELEKELILKWRSPFNKECWSYWGQPFGK